MRGLLGLLLSPFVAGTLEAQAAIASDLWRVAAGTLAVPAPVLDDGLAPLWTPAVHMSPEIRVRVGVESIHAPEQIGVTGSMVGATIRSRAGTIAIGYGRIGFDDIERTETSPETVGRIPVYVSTLSVGIARGFGPRIVGGIAARYAGGRLDDLVEQRLGLDVGLVYRAHERLRVGAATRFLDPLLGHGEEGSSYQVGLEYTSPPIAAWGVPLAMLARYGASVHHGEAAQHLLTAGLAFARSLALDVGAAHEAIGAEAVWRSRAAVTLGAGRYRVQVGRDGGVHDFGATYRFSLTAEFR